jgi:hypothetical protein
MLENPPGLRQLLDRFAHLLPGHFVVWRRFAARVGIRPSALESRRRLAVCVGISLTGTISRELAVTSR